VPVRLGLNQTGKQAVARVMAAPPSAAPPSTSAAGRRSKIWPLTAVAGCQSGDWDNHWLASNIEKWSLRLYGLAFLVFNVVYWLYYGRSSQVQGE